MVTVVRLAETFLCVPPALQMCCATVRSPLKASNPDTPQGEQKGKGVAGLEGGVKKEKKEKPAVPEVVRSLEVRVWESSA